MFSSVSGLLAKRVWMAKLLPISFSDSGAVFFYSILLLIIHTRHQGLLEMLFIAKILLIVLWCLNQQSQLLNFPHSRRLWEY
jgi:hypothetical protein